MAAETLQKLLTDLNGKRVTVMGLGHFGGQIAAIQFLAEHGAQITVTDRADQAALTASMLKIQHLHLRDLQLGGHREQDFTQTDLVIASPAVPPHNPYLQLAINNGITVTSEIALFWQTNPARVIGVSGTIGKSTTAAMIHTILQQNIKRNVWLGGNIGNSLLPMRSNIIADDWVILELSSFQLHYLNQLKASPHISVLTNFHPHHLDWHGTQADYAHAKQTLFRWQSDHDYAVLPAELCHEPDWQSEAHITTPDDTQLDPATVSQLHGQHNKSNARFAVAACLAADAQTNQIATGLQQYKGLPHRLQFVGKVNGVTFINDSKSTSSLATRAALQSFEQPVILLTGGVWNESDLTDLLSAIGQNVKAVACLGAAAPVIANQLRKQIDKPIHCARSLQDAFDWSVQQSRVGDVVLLSPGCASYDWFTNYQERGDQFTLLVNQRAE